MDSHLVEIFSKYFTNIVKNLDIPKENKNTLTGPAICKKTTRHHAHLSLCAKSRKTNDANSRQDQKPQFGQSFDDFEVKYLQIANFF